AAAQTWAHRQTTGCQPSGPAANTAGRSLSRTDRGGDHRLAGAARIAARRDEPQRDRYRARQAITRAGRTPGTMQPDAAVAAMDYGWRSHIGAHPIGCGRADASNQDRGIDSWPAQ